MKKGIDYIGVGTGVMILNANNEFLLCQRGLKAGNERGKWEFPGGTTEFGETTQHAVIREIKEELGIDIEIIQSLGAVDHILPEEKSHWVSFEYLGKITSGVPRIQEPEKCIGIKWLKINDIDLNELSNASKLHYFKYIETLQ